MKKSIRIDGIVSVSKSAYGGSININQGDETYSLQEIIMKALGDEIPNGYDNKYVGRIMVTIALKDNSIGVMDGDETIFSPLNMGGKE